MSIISLPAPFFISEIILEYRVPKQTQTKKKDKIKEEDRKVQPWISMHSGIIIMAFTSLALALFIAWQVSASRGWGEGILWGLLFAALIWAIFFGNLLITRFLRK